MLCIAVAVTVCVNVCVFFSISRLVLLSGAIKPSLIGIKYNTQMKTHKCKAARLLSRWRVLCASCMFLSHSLSYSRNSQVWGLILRNEILQLKFTIVSHLPHPFILVEEKCSAHCTAPIFCHYHFNSIYFNMLICMLIAIYFFFLHYLNNLHLDIFILPTKQKKTIFFIKTNWSA